MQNIELIFPEEIYSEHLATINEIKFTRREIDIISCLLNARGTSKIASLLSIALRTVVTHIRNIMLKLECNSREGIIDFIERSHKLSFLREYYAALTTEVAFEKSLKEVSKLKHEGSPNSLVIYWEDENQKQILLTHLDRHLCLAGFKVEIREYDDANRLEFTEDSSIISLLFAKKELSSSCPELEELNSLDLTALPSYYLSIFEILKKLLPKADINKIFATFQDHSEGLQGSYREKVIRERTPEKRESKEINSLNKILQIFKNSKWPLGVGIICISFLIMSYWVMRGKEGQGVTAHSHQAASSRKDGPIRSDLVIPTQSVLLNRPELITEIDNKLKNQHGIQTIALVGPGGAGKTTLARQYAHEQKASVIWEINAETLESLQSSFENLAQFLAKTEEDKKVLRGIQDAKDLEEKERKTIQFVKERFRSHPSWLFIFDNVEKFSDIQKYFPQDVATWGEGKIILTTRDNNIQNNKYISEILHIGELNFDQKIDLFTKIMNQGNKHYLTSNQNGEIKAFLEKIPSFPLDISIAAYYLKATQIPYATYLKNISKYDEDFEFLQESILKEAGNYAKTRYGIIKLSLQNLIHANKDFQDLLLFIGLLDSQNIPRDLLDRYKSKSVVDNFIYNLKKHSLIVNESGFSLYSNSALSIHRSTQSVILAYFHKILNLENHASFLSSPVNILKEYINDNLDRKDSVERKLLATHCEKFLSHKKILSPVAYGQITGELGHIYYSLSDQKKARECLQKSFDILSTTQPIENLSLARILSYLGIFYWGIGEFNKAESSLEKALELYKKSFRGNYKEVAETYMYQGILYSDQRYSKKAEVAFKKSIKIYKKYLPRDSKLAFALSYLGHAYLDLVMYDEAKENIEESILVSKKYFPRNHVEMGTILTNLSHLYSHLEEFEKTKDICEEVFAIYNEHYSRNSRHMAWALRNLGTAYNDLGNAKRAKELLEKSVQVFKKLLGYNNIKTKWALNCLGEAYSEIGDTERAKSIFYECLKVYEIHYGKESLEVARIMLNLGKTYLREGNLEASEDYFCRALKIKQQNKYPRIYMALEGLTEVYLFRSEKEKNKKLMKESQILKNKALNYLKQAQEVIQSQFPKDSIPMIRVSAKLKKLENEAR